MLSTSSVVRCSRGHRLIAVSVLGAAVFCYTFVSLVDRWGWKPARKDGPRQVATSLHRESSSVRLWDGESFWEAEYSNRVARVRQVCEHDEMAMMRRVWRVAANRRFGKKAFCKTRLCPIVVDEKRVLFFCFIPKVASTKVKEFFLNVSGVAVNDTVRRNETAFHLVANAALQRVSPMYYPATTARRFYKIMFVRHPFDRLVSTFRNKAEPPREQVQYFYDKYWDKIIVKLRPNQTIDDNSKITFAEFIWYLTHSFERDYDEHWAPYWSRCDPCLVDYDFIGKLETASHDFPYAFEKVGLESPPSFWSTLQHTERSLTLKYFSQVSQKAIRDLYRIYKLDFELFGYTLDGFLDKT